jgi:hypothetical protein
LSLLRPSPSSPPSSGPYLLDLGCCVAQELRSLAHAGIPSAHLYGSDLIASYLTTSFQLFNDTSTFHATLVPANIFSPTLFSEPFQGWESKFTVVHAGLFLHLFSWEQQVTVCENVIRLLKEEEGSMFLGEMVGCRGGGERGPKAPSFWKKGQERKHFLHDETSFLKLWSEVEEKTAGKDKWVVESRFRERGKGEGGGDGGSKGGAFFNGEGIGWITFSVERF